MIWPLAAVAGAMAVKGLPVTLFLAAPALFFVTGVDIPPQQ